MAAVPSPAAPAGAAPARTRTPAPPRARAPQEAPRPREAPGGDRRPDLRVVTRPRRRSRLLLALAALAVAGLFAIVGLHALAAHASFEAQALEAEVAALSDEADELSARVAALESPDRIRAVARDDLGMVPAEQARFVQLDPWADELPGRGVADQRDGDADPRDG